MIKTRMQNILYICKCRCSLTYFESNFLGMPNIKIVSGSLAYYLSGKSVSMIVETVLFPSGNWLPFPKILWFLPDPYFLIAADFFTYLHYIIHTLDTYRKNIFNSRFEIFLHISAPYLRMRLLRGCSTLNHSICHSIQYQRS